ncbi:hypothetical protein AMTRI_Chr08g205220 [Amborella trichopoda]
MGGERNMSTRLSTSWACSISNNLPPILMSLVFLVLVTVQTLPIPIVLPEERFLMGKLGPKRVYWCLVQ